jgi:hypothetical protein
MATQFRQSRLRITVSFGIALAVAAALFAIQASAQTAGTNVNVLPVLTDQNGKVIPPVPDPNDPNPPNPPSDPDAHLKGDYYLQRQVEPSIAVSTRNPNHIVAFFNDYRNVEIPDDGGLGQTARAKTGFLERFLAWLSRRPSPTPKVPPPTAAAAAEAWVGMARSYDGLTWSGGLVPGALWDNSPASLASPAHGLEAGTDPVVAAAPCGTFYVVWVAFTREGSSKILVSRYEDLNNSELDETIVYLGTTVAEVGQNDGAGHFHDKPAIAVDHARGTSVDPCAHNVYIAWARFNGVDQQGKFHSIMNFMRSTDKGLSFTPTTPVKLDGNTTRGQGAAIAVDPRPGTPTTTGGGTVYVGWRHFFGPATILLTKSTDFGATFPGQPLNILGSSEIQSFDQPSLATTSFPPQQIAFRSNGLPSLTVTGDGTIFGAWQERVDISTCGDPPGPNCGLPDQNGSPRIVLVKSAPGGNNWTNATGGPVAQRSAVDFGDRDDPNDPNLPAPGFGTLPMSRASGPQVMPKLMFGGGRLLLTYYESRGILAGNDTVQLTDLTPPAPNFISGIDRWMDLRSALLDPATGALLGTAQVSRYPIKNDANLADGEGLADVQAVNPPCAPDDSGPGLPPCVRRVNRVGGPTSASGTTPFIGDYIDVTPIVQFVPVGQTAWKWATDAADVPYRAFRTIFTDLRNQVPPTHPPGFVEWQRYPFYSVPGSGGTQCNAGSRNADVLTSLVNAELVVSAPVTFKQLGQIQVSFPVFVQNNTNTSQFFRLTITAGAGVSSFDQTSNIDSIDTEIYKFSSVTRVVYVDKTAPTNTLVQVSVQEITGLGGAVVPNGLSGMATINGDPTNPSGDPVTTETHNPTPFNPTPINPTPFNPTPFNPTPFNPTPFNVPIFDTTYKTWQVESEGTTQSAYTSLINVDDADGVDTDNLYQVIVWKNASAGGLIGCDAAVVPQNQILVNITNPTPFNPTPFNPTPFNPTPFNATYTVAPSDTGSAVSSHDGTKHAPKKGDSVYVTAVAHQKKPNCPPNTPDTDACVSPAEKKNFAVNPPTLTVFASSCDVDANGLIPDGCRVGFAGPDLVALTPITASPTNPKRRGFVKFPAGGWTLQNIGTQPATAVDGAFTHNIYLSIDAAVGPEDVLLGVAGITTGSLAAGAQQAFSEPTVRIPVGTIPGAYHLCLSVDDGREVSEVKEVNNFVCVPITVAQ